MSQRAVIQDQFDQQRLYRVGQISGLCLSTDSACDQYEADSLEIIANCVDVVMATQLAMISKPQAP